MPSPPSATGAREVERDFSDMEVIFADSRANTTELLEAKMMVKSSLKNEANNCARRTEGRERLQERNVPLRSATTLPVLRC